MKIEVRSDHVSISGYVNAAERDSRIMKTERGPFVEQVRSGVWQDAIRKNNNIALLLNHDWNKKLGSTMDNLKLKEDSIGLYAEARVYDRDVIEKAQNDRLVGWSFGFNTQKDSWSKNDNEIDRRYLEEIELVEVSILDNTRTPAYFGTSLESRESKELICEHRSMVDEVEVIRYEKRETKTVDERLKLIEIELNL